MKKVFCAAILSLVFGSASYAAENNQSAETASEKAAETASDTMSEKKKSYDFPKPFETRVIEQDEAFSILESHDSELLVVNYWATFCGPCVEEMPYFQKVSKAYEPSKVRVVGYSLDFIDPLQRVPEFLKQKDITYSNLVLKVDPNEYIDKVSPAWKGDLPATFFYNSSGEKLGEVLGVLEQEELIAKVKEMHQKAIPAK